LFVIVAACGPAGARSPAGVAQHHLLADARRSVSYGTQTMGTYANIIVVTADSAASAPLVTKVFSVFDRVDSLMSNWTTTSEVARVNRVAASGPTPVQPEVAGVVEAALAAWHQSEGAFDITVEPLVRAWGFIGGPRRVPSDSEATAAARLVGAQRVHFDPGSRTLRFDLEGMRIDLGGIAKGHAVDAAADTLRANGVTDALVNISGNMLAIGAPVGSDHWRIGIRDPRDRMPYFARLDLRPTEGISTSAKYEQFVAQNGRTYGHIMDPRTGRPAEGLIAVTVVAPTAMSADAWSTSMFVLGPVDARRKARERDDVAAVLVQPGGDGVDTVWVESALHDRFALEPRAQSMFRVVFF
jgi:thiamine biosynthesis lipoprotein